MKLKGPATAGIVCAAILLAGCGRSPPNHPEVPGRAGIKALLKGSTGHVLRPGDEVMLTKLGYGCESRNTLARAVEQQNLGRMSDLRATIGNYPACITQSEFPGQHWTVTAVHPPLVQIGVVNPEDVKNFKRAAPRLGKSAADNYKNRYWVPPHWLLKIHSQ